jgi:multidrug efflux system membrane fusion protein
MRRKTVILTAVLIVVLGGGGVFAFKHAFASKNSAAPPAPPPVPIVAGVVAQHDVPIYLTGVGTVIAYNTDVVRAQIQGQIISINFTEGQHVHTGDLLAQISVA